MHGFDYGQLLLRFRYPLLILLLGLVLGGAGLFIFKSGLLDSSTKVDVLSNSVDNANGEIAAEISGAVMTPGVYDFQNDARVEDLLTLAGGLSADADRGWTDKYLNRAAKLTDGQKVYIPYQLDKKSANSSTGDQTISSDFSSDSNDTININTASLTELTSLPGIGQVYGQNIIEHRPYSTTEELVSKGAIGKNLYEKIKNSISVY